MTLRWKIFGLAALLLGIFAAAAAASVLIYRSVQAEIGGFRAYHLPIQAAIAELDVMTSDFERTIGRVLLWEAVLDSGKDTEQATSPAQMREEMVSDIRRIRQDIDRIENTLASAVADPSIDLTDRLLFAELKGTLQLVRQRVDPYEGDGLRVLEAFDAGETVRARRLFTLLIRHDAVFDAQLGTLRQLVAGLTEASLDESFAEMSRAALVTMSLLLLSALLGLLLSGAMTRRMLTGLNTLIDATRSMDRSRDAPALPVRSSDEIGELTEAYNSMVEELRAKDHIRDTFGKYLDPRVVSALVESTGEEAAERRVITVFFSDIVGFTSMSEVLTAQVMVRFLNAYFTVASDSIRDHHGIVDKYIGDAVMAFWTPPFSAGDSHATDACLSALAQQRALAELRRKLPDILGLRRDLPELGVKMGLATGEAVIGTVGSPTTKSYTAIGDTVNLASRLEGLNKVYGTLILTNEDTWRLAQGAVEGREVDMIAVAGKTEAIRIHEIVSPIGAAPEGWPALAETYAAALARYRGRDWDGADRLLAECLGLAPEDGPSLRLRGRIAAFRAAPPPDGWDGVWRFDKK